MDSHGDEAGKPGSLDRVAEHYDRLPYDSMPIFNAHPGRIAGVAKLFGLEPPALENARVLEIGCASGGHLIPLGFHFPAMRCLGIDLSKQQIDDGLRRIARLGLTNVELRHASITEIGDEIGQFDFIVTHGVYSWVPQFVREKILEISSRNLAPGGIAYISYNVLPGWRMMQPLRDAFRVLIPKDLPETQRAALGRRLLGELADMTPDSGAYGDALREMRGRLQKSAESYLFHEYMEDVNEPMLFGEFVADADRHGLAYLGETTLYRMYAERYGNEFAAKIDAVTDNDIVSYEQMLDILTGNKFRSSLLVHRENAASIDRNFTPARLASLNFVPSQLIRCEFADGKASLHVDDECKVYDYEPIVRLLSRLFAVPPRTVTFADMMDGLDEEEGPETIMLLKNLVIAGVATVTTDSAATGTAGARPTVSALARADAAAGEIASSSRLHRAVDFGGMPEFVLPLMDGSRDRAALRAAVHDAIRAGKIEVSDGSGELPDQDRLDRAVHAMIEDGLAGLSANGLIEC